MAKHPISGLKRRTREHVIADLSVNHVERHVLLCGYSVERARADYGTDLYLFTYDHDGAIEPGLIFLQLKATEKLRRVANRTAIPVRVERRDLAAWLRQIEPMILVVYDVRSETAYWLDVQSHCRVPPTRLRGTTTIRIPTSNVLDSMAVRTFARLKERVHLRFPREEGDHEE